MYNSNELVHTVLTVVEEIQIQVFNDDKMIHRKDEIESINEDRYCEVDIVCIYRNWCLHLSYKLCGKVELV